jgi:hypothetical protein
MRQWIVSDGSQRRQRGFTWIWGEFSRAFAQRQGWSQPMGNFALAAIPKI